MSDCRVFIVLATCQGEAFLPQLLASVRAQSYPDWTLLARDDQSHDGTRQVLREAVAADGRIVLMEDDSPRLGASGNFARLLQEAHRRGADYVLLADQDDVWHSDKVARQVEALRTGGRMDCQSVQNPDGVAIHPAPVIDSSLLIRAARPQLVFCDATVIDAADRQLHGSFLRHNGLPYQSNRPLVTLLGRSFVLGCACAVNRGLLEFALPLPHGIASHDWWLALCAAVSGEITCLDVPLLDYRRHGANASQAAIWSVFPILGGWRRRWQIGWDHFQRSLAQARALSDRLRERQITTGASAEMLEAFCRIVDEPNRWRRLAQLHRLGVPRIGYLRHTLYDVCTLMKRVSGAAS